MMSGNQTHTWSGGSGAESWLNVAHREDLGEDLLYALCIRGGGGIRSI